MITPKEIETKEFTTTKGGGYKADEVDQFLDDILVDYSRLLEERNSLKNKIALLTDKLTEFANRPAPAPTPVDEIPVPVVSVPDESENLSAARKKAQRLVSDAEDYAKKLIETAQFEANRQNSITQKLTSEIETFKNALLDTYAQHVKMIEDIPNMQFEDVKIGSETLDILNESLGQTEDVSIAAPTAVSSESVSDRFSIPDSAPTAAATDFANRDLFVSDFSDSAIDEKRPSKGLEELFDEEELKKKKKEPKKKKKLFFRDEEEDDDFFDDDDE